MSKIIRAALILGIVFILSGCSTIEGAGEDVQHLAQSGRVWLQEYAQK